VVNYKSQQFLAAKQEYSATNIVHKENINIQPEFLLFLIKPPLKGAFVRN